MTLHNLKKIRISSTIQTRYYAVITSAYLMMNSSNAHANGLSGMFKTAKTQSTSINNSITTILATLGVPIAGYGVLNWYRKSKEGDHSNIQAVKIWGPIIAGVGMTGLGFLLDTFGETIGMNPSDRVSLDSL